MIHRPVPEKQCTHKTGQLYGASRSLFVAQQIKQFKGLSVVVTHDMAEAEQLEKEIRFFRDGQLSLLNFPDLETLPYDNFSPHQDIISDRLHCLATLPQLSGRAVLFLSIGTLLQKISPADYISSRSFSLKTGDILDLTAFKIRLTEQAYQSVSQVEQHGEFTVRGSIIDLFPMGSATPFRIELFDDEIESIRSFDVETQRSIKKLDKIELLPAREFPLDQQGIKQFRQGFRQTFEVDPKTCPVYEDISQGISSPGIEYYLPLFFEQLNTLFDYLPQKTQFLMEQSAFDGCDNFLQQVEQRYESRRYNLEHPLLKPDQLFLTHSGFNRALQTFPVSLFSSYKYEKENDTTVNMELDAPPLLTVKHHNEEPLQTLKQYLEKIPHHKILFCAESSGRREFLIELLRHHDIRVHAVGSYGDFNSNTTDKLFITVSPLEEGLQLNDSAVTFIAESQLFGDRAKQTRHRKYRKTRDAEAIINTLADLSEGAPVVHEDYGIGRYLGLKNMTVADIETEFLCIEYANQDKLYVPVSSLHLISRYTGAAEEKAPLHKLGTDHWIKVRKKAQQKIHDIAAELLEIHARREALKGYQFSLNKDEYQQFSSDFPFEVTPDQESSIESVMTDMTSIKPMDRIVCGDVGFGKTEVSMRAAFIAANTGKQVVVLVPTTLLAQQHYQNFLDRFAEWPFKLALLSRFTSRKDLTETLSQIKLGKIDIVIGTHKLLSDDIKYKDLGLVIIDEEHRFGVRHKEKLKALRAQVDLLTLTATPIPRTLNMSLAGMRDLSIIATPPMQRHAIKTFVSQWNDDSIIEGCQRELKRGGQIYFLHNEVKSIEKMASELQDIIPEARIGIAHGQMKEKELEHVMLDFYHHRCNLLVCTTIIESGIDVPTANTIFINRADKLGLAQLHQIRGRVGRSHHRAFAYMITPHPKAMTSDARKRLQAIESLEDLGVGFTLATHDLEIRGAGELLGDDQSGQITEIGFTLYSELLERAVHSLKSNRELDFDQPLMRASEIDFHVPALIPADYIPDVHHRLIEYKRLSSAANDDDIRNLKMEMIDRFGVLPEPLQNLFQVTELKIITKEMGIQKIDFGAQTGRIIFSEKPNIDPMKIIQLIQKKPLHYQFDGKQTMTLTKLQQDLDERFIQLKKLLTELTAND
ncbi:MAG: transcription-repair coupling factor [Gammaproteobacteria bacterium]|nr:transcription-repair coupling factor [Gammaproteobacteria bacterium]